MSEQKGGGGGGAAAALKGQVRWEDGAVGAELVILELLKGSTSMLCSV